MSILDHDGMLPMKQRHPDWVWNRSDTHVTLGVPEAPEAFTTVVEPGNAFSPGFRSYAVTTWISTGEQVWAPELLPLAQLRWRWSEGFLPVLECTWSAGDLVVRSSLYTDGDPARRDIRTHAEVTVTNEGADPVEGTLHVLIRSFGPAGAQLRRLALTGSDLLIDGAVVASFLTPPDHVGAIGYEESGTDVGELIRAGQTAPGTAVDDPAGWASGSAGFALALGPGESRTVGSVHYVHAGHPHLDWLRRAPAEAAERPDRARFEERWRALLPMQLDLPDPAFAEALQAQAVYLAMSSVGVEPRISPISYPLWWLRDGSYALTAMGKAGLSDWVDRAVRSVAARAPFGGFGSEGDGAGQLIWVMTEHARIRGDDTLLAELYPDIRRNADLVVALRHTPGPVFGRTEIRTPQMMVEPSADLMARPPRDGLINGRMDGHFPRFWVNGWAAFGLRRAIEAARALGEDTRVWQDELDAQLAAIAAVMPEHFGENDRDYTGSIWPTGYADPTDPHVREVFARHWDQVRHPGGVHVPEPEWTYFEAGQAHNHLLLGERDRAWVTIRHFLEHSTAPGLYTQHEGIGDENSSLQWQRSRGWDDIPHVTPHGWTAAELLLLLRDCLLRETSDGALVIGSGVPASWLAHDFSVSGAPSWYGAVSLRWDAGARRLRVTTERPVPTGVRHELPASDVDLVVADPVAAAP